MSTHGGDSFPGPNSLFGRVHRVSRSLVPSSRWFRSFVPSFQSLVPSSRSLVPYLQIHHTLPSFGKRASLTPGIIYTIIVNTLVRRMPVLKTPNGLNLISTVRAGTKTRLELLTMRRGPPPVCLVRSSFLSYVPFVTLKSFYK